MAKSKEKITESEPVNIEPKQEEQEPNFYNLPDMMLNNEEPEPDSYFKNVVNQLMSADNVETKTEYRNVQENFAGAKLTFVATHGNIPYLDKFIEVFERKRISLERKGRKELIMALIEREREMQRESDTRMQGILGINGR